MRVKRKIKKSQFLSILAGFIFILFIFFVQTWKIQAKDESKKILFISSYNESYATVPDQIRGLQSVLGDKVMLDIEYMDTKRLDTAENKQLFYELIKFKLKNLPAYDAVIVGDDNALQFIMEHKDELFPQTPIVFFGINNWESGRKAAEDPLVTGILEKFSLVETINVAKSFKPGATKVVAIVDSSLTGQGDQRQFNEVQETFADLQFSLLNVSDYTFEEFSTILGTLNEDTILLFLSMSQDKTGTYMNMADEYAFIKEHTKIPVYNATFGGVGAGLMGGKLIDYEAFGKISGELVMEILGGKPVESIDVIEETPYYYIFDYDLIEKFNIDKRLIPVGSVLVNKEENPMEKYWGILASIGITVIFLTLVTLILIADNLKRRTIQKALGESNEKLKTTFLELEEKEEELRNQYEIIKVNAVESEILNQKYAIATETTNSAVWELNLTNSEIMISENFSQIVNHKIKKKENIFSLMDLLLDQTSINQLSDVIDAYQRGEISEINIQIPIMNGEQEKKWILIRGRGIKQENQEVKQLHGILMDTTKMKEQEDYIKYLATHDYLTKLPNRLNFLNQLSNELDDGKSGAVFLFDIDNFKGINDTQGHVYGDELLKIIAERLKNNVDKKMFAARLGGDEFLILIKNTNNHQEINTYAKKVIAIFDESFRLERKENYISISMGVTCFPEDSVDIDQLIMHADTAMYSVKHSDKNNYAFYQNDMKKDIDSRVRIEEILRNALKNDGFKLVYQPQVDLKTGMIDGFEALLRLKEHAIRPDQFIPIAEETGLIIKIGRWVTKEAVEQFVRWRDKGLGEKKIAINYSSKQLKDKDYVKYLENLLDENKVKTELIEIEITESILLENNKITMDFLHELKTAGFKIALDDFGTGYSSLHYLTYIPVDKVKLDKSINDKFLNLENNKVMGSLIFLAHSLNLKITAEGVEVWGKYLRLKDGGCDYIQGYLFSKPLAPEEVEKVYSQNFIEAAQLVSDI
nr:ABC transporter substrate binding protein [uncultured Acetobacterium sp.]